MGWKDFVVQVVANGVGGGRSIATGYPVSHGRILTALHAVKAKDRDIESIEVHWCCMSNPSRAMSPATVVWPLDSGTDSDDVAFDTAVLECEFPSGVEDYVRLSPSAPASTSNWESEGFARIKDDGEPVGLSGSVCVKAEKYEYMELGNDKRATTADKWMGASGCPVVVNRRVVGVVTKCLAESDGSIFKAAPAWVLLQIDGFRDACQLGLAEASLRDDARKLHQKLLQLPDLRIELGLAENDVDGMVEKLESMSATGFLESALEAADIAQTQGDLDRLRAFTFQVLPYKFNRPLTVVDPVTGVVAVPAVSEATLDAHMSGMHYRPVSLLVESTDVEESPTGEFNMGRLAPTGIGREAFVGEFSDVLQSKFLSKARVKGDAGEKTPEQRTEDILRQKKRSKRKREAWYYEADEPGADRFGSVVSRNLSEIKRRYPSVELVERVGCDDESEDHELRDLLTELVHKKIETKE